MSESLGILRLEGLVYFVHDASRSHQFYVERLDFAYIGNSSFDYEQSTGKTSKVYKAGNCQVVMTSHKWQNIGGNKIYIIKPQSWKWLVNSNSYSY